MTIDDEFSALPVSRQRKCQLRHQRDGKCIVCGKARVTAIHCEHHRRLSNRRQWEKLQRELGNPSP